MKFYLLVIFCKLLVLDGYSNKSPSPPKTVLPKAVTPPSPVPIKKSPVIPTPEPITIITSSEPRVEDKRFKVKNRNKSKKEAEKKVEKPVKQETKVRLVESCADFVHLKIVLSLWFVCLFLIFFNLKVSFTVLYITTLITEC